LYKVSTEPESFAWSDCACITDLGARLCPRTPAAAVGARFLVGKDLLARCMAPAQAQDYCYGYVAAVYDSVRAYETWLNIRDMCVPEGTVQGELRKAVVDYLGANKQHLEAQAASVVVIALAKRFPCAGAPPRPSR
jgi:hypothetical protein